LSAKEALIDTKYAVLRGLICDVVSYCALSCDVDKISVNGKIHWKS